MFDLKLNPRFAAAGLLALFAGPLRAQTVQPPQPQLPKGAAQLKSMYIDNKLFTPDKWWKYDGADDDRPDQYSVEQEGKVTIGGQAVVNVGAMVRYQVTVHPDEASAHSVILKMVPPKVSTPVLRREIRKTRSGAEGFEVEEKSINKEGKTTYVFRQTLARYGKYVVEVNCASDLKAFGPRPASGERAWMCDPVYLKVRSAALRKWDNYRVLTASSAAPAKAN